MVRTRRMAASSLQLPRLDFATPEPCVPADNQEGEGEECVLHTYETRFDTRGQRITLRVGTKSEFDNEKDPSYYAAFVVVRQYNSFRALISTDFQIRSPYVQKAIREVIRSYPGMVIPSVGRIVIIGEPQCLFHYHKELQEYAEVSSDQHLRQHMRFCQRYMAVTLEKEISAYERTVVQAVTDPGLEYPQLWMAYKPGTLLYYQVDGFDTVVRLKSMYLQSRARFVNSPPRPLFFEDDILPEWHVEAVEIQCNGNDFGYVIRDIWIKRYDGSKPFIQLDTFPLEYHPDQQAIRDRLFIRGKKFISMLGIHHRQYDGQAQFCRLGPFPPMIPPAPVEFDIINIQNRIMLDCRGFRLNAPYRRLEFLPGSRLIKTKDNEHLHLPDDELLLCAPTWPGYSLGNKRWGLFDVDKIVAVEYNVEAFGSLVLPKEQKDLISSLVRLQTEKSPVFDDLIKGKGKGLIFLLHGPPGVGKTFTAESIADYTGRPLFTITSGQLPQGGGLVELDVTRILDLATRWNALVLIDEADVFMQQRTYQDIGRNNLVTVLLRVLEYFQGIMILTSNRVETIDSAFKSRIHLAISYPTLSFKAKAELWRAGIIRGCSGRRLRWLTPKFIDGLAAANVNGREIKNIIRIAHSLALNGKRLMKASDILQGVKALELFNTELSNDNSPSTCLDSERCNCNAK